MAHQRAGSGDLSHANGFAALAQVDIRKLIKNTLTIFNTQNTNLNCVQKEKKEKYKAELLAKLPIHQQPPSKQLELKAQNKAGKLENAPPVAKKYKSTSSKSMLRVAC